MIDDHRTWPGVSHEEKRIFTDHYSSVLGMSDLVLTNCEPVQEAMKKFSKNIHLVPNGFDLESENKNQGSSDRLKHIVKLEGPKIGYVGALEKKIDVDLLKHIAKSRPKWNISLIGSAHAASTELSQLREFENVRFLGVVPYDELADYINAFDVAILPHKDSEMTRSMNPLKAFVYLSKGVPTVCTRIKNLGGLEKFILIADDKKDFITKIEQALTRGKGISDDLLEFMRKNSWNERVNTVLDLIRTVIKGETINYDYGCHLNYEGVCSICGQYSAFKRKALSIRETFRCLNCRGSLREREQAHAILSIFPELGCESLKDLAANSEFRKLRIFEPGVTGPFRRILKPLPSYHQSFYWEDVPSGSYRDGLQCQDLSSLSFSDSSFDLVITSDILEHIRHPMKAFKEIFRVLTHNGYHIFTVPLPHPIPEETTHRVDTSNSSDIFLLPPVYHGNGAGGRSLVYTDFGLDLLPALASVGFEVQLIDRVSGNETIEGLYTFVCRKP